MENTINEELKNPISSIDQYKLGEKLGEGTFGTVYLATHKLTKQKVAIKIIEKKKLRKEIDKIRLEREITILKKLHHSNIINLYSTIETNSQIYLIQEYASGKELFDYIIQKKKLCEKETLKYFQQIISGIEYIHKLGICHRDLKPENIILTLNNEIKIIDFGLSNFYNKNQLLKSVCGSPCYAAPEILKGNIYSGLKIDIWSCGIILYMMITGNLPFNDNNQISLYKQIIHGKYYIPSFVPKKLSDLIKNILVTNPKKRFNLNDIKEHSWFKNENMKNNFHFGINLNEIIIPIDEDIIEIMNEMNFNKQEVRENILRDEHNNICTTYYLLLNKKIKRGKSSISDLKSLEFENYIIDKNNFMEKYNFNIETVIKMRSYSKGILNEIPFRNYINKDYKKLNDNNTENNYDMNDKEIKIIHQKSESNIINKRNEFENDKKNKSKSLRMNTLSHSANKKINPIFYKKYIFKTELSIPKRKEKENNKAFIKKCKPIFIQNINLNSLGKERTLSIKKIEKKKIFSPLKDEINKQKSQINILKNNFNHEKKNEKTLIKNNIKKKTEKRNYKNNIKSYSVEKSNNSIKNSFINSFEKEKNKNRSFERNEKYKKDIKSYFSIKKQNNIKKEKKIKKEILNIFHKNLSNLISQKHSQSVKELKSSKQNLNNSINYIKKKSTQISNEKKEKIKKFNKQKEEKLNIKSFKLIKNKLPENDLLNLKQKLKINTEKNEESKKNIISNQNINQKQIYNKFILQKNNESDLKNPLQFNLLNLYFKSKNQIKEKLIHILNSNKIKFRIDKKNQFKFICEKQLINEFEINIVQTYLPEISIVKFKLLKGVMTQYNEIIEKICIKLNK